MSGCVAVIGAGPAGLMAAEVLASRGHRVDVYDAMTSPGRKLLLAGIGGLNLTHSEPTDAFIARYRERADVLAPLLAGFGADELRHWAHGLGIETFVGSSGRVFPVGMKAAPLLRAWLHRLREAGVRLHVRHRWIDWQDRGEATRLRVACPDGERQIAADAVVLALGGASWPRLGSDGAWVERLTARGVEVARLKPANCGFVASPLPGTTDEPGWSPHFRERFAGAPLKSVAATFIDAGGGTHRRIGECVVSATGLEGGLIYALSAPLRDTLEAKGEATLMLDFAPGRSHERLVADLSRPRGSRSIASHLQSKTGIAGVKAALLRECLPPEAFHSPSRLAHAIKALPVRFFTTRPLAEAISTAGGVRFEELDERLMLRKLPGVFCCGEMLDWEAPTGGYLLTACFATGRAAGLGAAAWLAMR